MKCKIPGKKISSQLYQILESKLEVARTRHACLLDHSSAQDQDKQGSNLNITAARPSHLLHQRAASPTWPRPRWVPRYARRRRATSARQTCVRAHYSRLHSAVCDAVHARPRRSPALRCWDTRPPPMTQSTAHVCRHGGGDSDWVLALLGWCWDDWDTDADDADPQTQIARDLDDTMALQQPNPSGVPGLLPPLLRAHRARRPPARLPSPPEANLFTKITQRRAQCSPPQC
ncbi:hypothetical protein B0H12DRAFT_1150301 [Mycena haematopus]|nr:hypothetical protein B0H12DRAFT_1150301 [Mycena haematopus]